ncbi:MAG: Feruloyl esterase [Ramlibacter sp.]|nr:Feruloyl esterase [Ramlibacter sp.]
MRNRFFIPSLAGLGVVLALAGCGGSDGDVIAPPPPATTIASAQQVCETLSGKALGGATVVSTTVVTATGTLPTFCRVSARMDPKLNFELRLPDNWNGKLLYGGGGGYNGSIPGPDATALKAGYANVSSDSGHQANGLDASWALNDPYAAQLFGSLSIPTVMSSTTELVRAAYSQAPTRSYFEGCSNGGREALMMAQRYPNLFDGIIARAPAYNWVGVMGAFNRTAKAQAAPGGALSTEKVALLASAVRTACDAGDGVADGIVSNPSACTFNPATLRCAGGADTGNSCLSDAQLAVVTSWTTPATFAGGTYRNAGWWLTGNEDDPGAWRAWVTGSTGVRSALQYLFSDTTVKTYLARDLTQESLTYTPYDQNPGALFGLAALNDATSTDLRPFINSGGKLILWHGGNDSALSTKTTAEYFAGLGTTLGAATVESNVRFYVAPGVNHCAGGPGADTTDLLASLDGWVVGNTAPATLTATKVVSGAVAFSRPLCRYPQYPRYTGPAGNAQAATLAANYTCTSP